MFVFFKTLSFLDKTISLSKKWMQYIQRRCLAQRARHRIRKGGQY